MDDYLELPIDADALDEYAFDLWMHSGVSPLAVLKDVASGCRRKGWWTVQYRFLEMTPATALIPESRIDWFTLIERPRHKDAP